MVNWTIVVATCVAGLAVWSSASSSTEPQYYLKTRVMDGGDAHFDGLYVESYHTGAGLSDATLSANQSTAVQGFLNETHQVFSFENNIAYGVVINSHIQSTGWSFVTIDAGEGDAGFSLDGNELNFNGTNFGGFLACDWWHNVPQLFWWIGYYDYPLPSSCANVTLVTEPLS